MQKGNLQADSSACVVRFGAFAVDLQTGELKRRGVRVKLQEQPFQLLVALLERPGEIVTREELRTRLWPSDTFVDFDHSLNAATLLVNQRKPRSSSRLWRGAGTGSSLRLPSSLAKASVKTFLRAGPLHFSIA